MDLVRTQIAFDEDAPTGKGVSVAVLDTGVDLDHPDLISAVDRHSSRVIYGLSTVLDDYCGHGTHMAGIIAGSGEMSLGRYRGLAPDARVIALKISNGDDAPEGEVVEAIDYAIELGVDIISYSNSFSPTSLRRPPGKAPWVWPAEPSAVERAFLAAASSGILCVCAAGNDGPAPGSINRPAGLDEVLAVGAQLRGPSVWEKSSRGPYRRLASLRAGGVRRYDSALDVGVQTIRKPDVVAPGYQIVSTRAANGTFIREHMLLDRTDPRCHYCYLDGTSPATAVVAGVAACLLEEARSRNVNLGPNPGTTLRRLIIDAARKLSGGTVDDFGNGALIWGNLRATLSEFATDIAFRDTILNPPRLALLAKAD